MSSYILQGGGISAPSLRSQDHHNLNDAVPIRNSVEGRNVIGIRSPSDSTSSRNGSKYYSNRGRRQSRYSAVRVPHSGRGYGVFLLIVLSVVSISVIGGGYLFSFLWRHKGQPTLSQTHDFFESQDQSSLLTFWNSRSSLSDSSKMNSNWEEDVDTENSHKRKRALQFGKASLPKEELVNRDSRYWDKDDRKRNKYSDYNSDVELDEDDGKTNHRLTSEKSRLSKKNNALKLSNTGNGGLYNEKGRKELREYEQKLEADLELENYASKTKRIQYLNDREEPRNHDSNKGSQTIDARTFNEDLSQPNSTEGARTKHFLVEEDFFYNNNYDELTHELGKEDHRNKFMDSHHSHEPGRGGLHNSSEMNNSMESSKILNAMHTESDSRSTRRPSAMWQESAQKTRHHERYLCNIDFLDTTADLQEPKPNTKFENFSLNYIQYEDPQGIAGWEPRFAGHQTLLQRNNSFIASDQPIHCGFIQEYSSSRSSGFDLTEEDTQYMSTCKVAVTSCIFGSSDNIRSPRNRRLTGSFKKDVCFVMFVDQQTLDVMKLEGQQVNERGYLGSWKIVLVRNMPYTDARRVGKIPKLLAHRLFPAARFSIWLDSKLRLQNDPVLILEYFLWRGGHEYAISNHYDRHCVWEEVQQNKKLNKYNHTAIDEQFAFYKADGLTRFNASDPEKLLSSNVPEGSFIIREHSPMSNLFSCLWFNEVDRFTSRDQLSFAYTYMKLVRSNPGKRFHLNMFKDCERKSIAKLFRHRTPSQINNSMI